VSPAERNGVKVVAIYFPQLHAIPENDAWWGKGFTDWVNVERARPLYRGHNQPRVPLGGVYYDQSEPAVIRRQVAMAREYGVGAFCHYHYWFDGKQLLETPTDLFLGMKDLDMEFCLSWANESWSRRWDGQEHLVLQAQTHPPTKEAWGRHFDYLIKAWTDRRALRIDGRPLFLIYRSERIPELGNMLDYWRERARKHGIDGLYFMTVVQHLMPPTDTLRHFDALFLFQPFVSYFGLRDATPPTPWKHWSRLALARVPSRYRLRAQTLLERCEGPTLTSYDRVWQRIIASKVEAPIRAYEGAFVDWDNTARYGRRATIYHGASPARFQHWMTKLVAKVGQRPVGERLIFLNAWNEWAEGAHLEPDEKSRFGYLEALRSALATAAPAPMERGADSVAASAVAK
jgi:hypothetical protein